MTNRFNNRFQNALLSKEEKEAAREWAPKGNYNAPNARVVTAKEPGFLERLASAGKRAILGFE